MTQMKIQHKIRVRNNKGSSKKWPHPACSCNNWIEHWKNNCDYQKPFVCPVCSNKPTDDNPWVGGHVQKVCQNDNEECVLANDQKIYIVPICKGCNNDGDLVFLVDKNYLVPMAKDECRADN